MTKATLKLLEDNRSTFRSLQQQQQQHRSSSGSGKGSIVDEKMDYDDKEDESIASVIERILSKEEYKDKRARSLGLDDFLQLLADFNSAGIHFAS